MAGAKAPATPEERLRAKDLGLQRKFGITLAEREERARQQNNLCKICGGPLDAHGYPCIDHFHFKVKTFRHDPTILPAPGFKWYGQAYDERGRVICVRYARTQAAAHKEVKQVMMRWSIRGILCGKCNYGLGYIERFFDAAAHPENLLPVIEYLRARLK
jgi:hypothetical protein